MIICHSRKFVFFSFPKTGSESVREMLADLNEETVTPYREATTDRPWYSHMSPAEAEAAFAARGWDIRDYFTFTVTRNPYARMVSIYEMVMAVDGFEKLKRRVGLRQRGFAPWLRATAPDGPGAGGRGHQRWRKFGTWSTRNWIAGQDGQPLVSKVLRLEHLATELPPVLERLG
ncbi:MAG: sulfotransferase family 2 domain-containing protein, partial [Pseudomonadota bacterium]